MRIVLIARILTVILAAFWLTLILSDSELPAPSADPRDACNASFPELDPCVAYVHDRIDSNRFEDLLDELSELGRAHPHQWMVPFLKGYAYASSGLDDPQRLAILHFKEADRLAKEANDPAGRARALWMLGGIEERQDRRIDEALKLYLEAAGHAETSKDDRLYFSTAWAVATSYRQLGRYEEQIDWMERGLDRIGEDGDRGYRQYALYAIGNSYRKIGDWQSSMRYLQLDLDSARRHGDEEEELMALQMLGNVQLDQDPEAAIPWFEQCAERAAKAELSGLHAHCEVMIGVALVQAGQLEGGRERLVATLDRALALAENDEEETVQGVANLLYLAEAERRLGETESALKRYEQARTKASQWNKPYFYWQVSAGLASLYLGQEKYDDALREARRGVDEVESLRGALEDEEHRIYYLRQRSNAYATLGAAIAGARPKDLDAQFEALERVHSRTLRETLEDRFDLGQAIDTPPLASVQARLGDGDVVLEYLLGEEFSLLLAITKGSAKLHRLPPRKEIEEQVERYRRVVQRPLVELDARMDPEADFRRLGGVGWKLFQTLTSPEATAIAAAKRLIIVPDKQLHRLPFGTLPSSDPALDGPVRFLAASHDLLYLPAASFLLEPGSKRADKVVVLAAGSAQRSLNLAELTQAPVELASIRRSYSADRLRVLDGSSATQRSLEAAIDGSVGTLHIIGHAVLDPQAGPEIVLSSKEPGGYELLDAAGIVAMAPTPRLVVLSACETGEGELVGGEGILGLVRAFRLSGSSRIVASLWKADDAAAAKLMGAFHSRLRDGTAPAHSLALARREVLEEGFVHPFGWGGFVLYGAD